MGMHWNKWSSHGHALEHLEAANVSLLIAAFRQLEAANVSLLIAAFRQL